MKRVGNSQFCDCGSLMIDGACTKRNCTQGKTRQMEWTISGQKLTFSKPVDFQQARNMYNKMSKKKSGNNIVEVDFTDVED